MAIEHSWEKKMDVVGRYLLLGNLRLVAEQTDVPYPTLINWKQSEWWGEIAEQLKKKKYKDQNNTIFSLINNSLEIIEDRLKNGDVVFNQKTGEVLKKPVSARDATAIMATLMQRQTAVDALEQKFSSDTTTVQETLIQLANEFKKFTKKQKLNDVEDAVIVVSNDALLETNDALSESRET